MQSGLKARPLQKMPFFKFIFGKERVSPAELSPAGCKSRACRGLWLASEIAKQRCLLCVRAAYAKRGKQREEEEEGEAARGRNLCAVGMTKLSIRLSGAGQAMVPARLD